MQRLYTSVLGTLVGGDGVVGGGTDVWGEISLPLPVELIFLSWTSSLKAWDPVVYTTDFRGKPWATQVLVYPTRKE